MDRSEKIKKAKEYIEQLANGINPLDGMEIPENEGVNNVKISRCLFFVSGLLEESINCEKTKNYGEKEQKINPSQKRRFYISQEELCASFDFSEREISGSEIVNRINSLIDTDIMQKLKLKTINNWLLNMGLLEEEETERGKRKKPTEAGKELGIVQKQSFYSGYLFTAYGRDAQHFIVDNIEAIISADNAG